MQTFDSCFRAIEGLGGLLYAGHQLFILRSVSLVDISYGGGGHTLL